MRNNARRVRYHNHNFQKYYCRIPQSFHLSIVTKSRYVLVRFSISAVECLHWITSSRRKYLESQISRAQNNSRCSIFLTSAVILSMHWFRILARCLINQLIINWIINYWIKIIKYFFLVSSFLRFVSLLWKAKNVCFFSGWFALASLH